MALCLLEGLGGFVTGLDEVHHLAEVDEFVADDLVVLVQGDLRAVAFSHLEVARTLRLGGEHGADLASQALPEVFHRSADGKSVFGERRLAAAVDDLKEQLAHGGIDGVADEVGVEGLENGLADQDLRCHSGGVGHAGAADGLNQGLFDDAVLDVQGQLAGALLGCAPAHAVGEAGNILDLLGLNPFALFGDGSRAVICALGDRTHVLNFRSVNHIVLPFKE